MILADRIRESFRAFATRPAISLLLPGGHSVSLSYRELGSATGAVAQGLAREGCLPGDLVLCHMQKSPGLAASLLAVICSGGVACCLNSKLKLQQALRLAHEAGAGALLVDQGSRSALGRLAGGGEGPAYGDPVALAAEGASGSGLYLVKIPPAPTTLRGGASLVPGGTPPPAFCLFTSGSTGTQKGVLISGEDLAARAITEAGYFGLGESDTLLSLLPLSFDVGLNQMLSCLLSGGHLVMMNSWFPKDIRSAISGCAISGISGVPFLWVELMSAFPRGFIPDDARSLRYLTVSGGDLSPAQLEGLRAACAAVEVFKTYGQTETFRSGILDPGAFSRKMTSVGLPVRGTRVSIVDDRGNQVPPDAEGEIVHHGAGTMLGYLNDPTGTRKKLRAAPEPDSGARAVYTGDRGRIDREGYLYVHGREDGMIKTAGQRVYPKEVEDCILRHPGVKRAAVVGIRDERKGQAIVAEIMVTTSVRAAEVLGFLRAELPSYMVPDRLEVVEGLPVSESGKVQYAAVRGKYEEVRVL